MSVCPSVTKCYFFIFQAKLFKQSVSGQSMVSQSVSSQSAVSLQSEPQIVRCLVSKDINKEKAYCLTCSSDTRWTMSWTRWAWCPCQGRGWCQCWPRSSRSLSPCSPGTPRTGAEASVNTKNIYLFVFIGLVFINVKFETMDLFNTKIEQSFSCILILN